MTSLMIKNKRRGRRTENTMAKLMNGIKQGLYGEEDISHSLFSIECKDRMKFTGKKFMEQAIANSPEGKVPMVIVHVTGDRHKNDLVMLRLSDWQNICPEGIFKEISHE